MNVKQMITGGGNRSTRTKPAPVSLCSPQITHDLLGSNTGRRGEKSSTNRLSYDTAYENILTEKNPACKGQAFALCFKII
jgi:hypothetical protein